MAFNDPRINVPEPGVTRVAPPQQGDNTTAAAITAFGDFVGEVRKGSLSADLKRDINQVVNEVTAIDEQFSIAEANQGRAPTIAELAGPDTVINETSDRFKRLKAARAQGKFTDARVHIEAEALLKNVINRAPGFAPEFRQQAKDILGIDPTGSLIRASIAGSTTNSTSRQTFLEKMQERANGLAQVLGINPKTALRRVAKAELAADNKAITNDQILGAQMSVPGLIAEADERISLVNDQVWAQALAEIDATGGIVNTESLIRSIRTQGATEIADITANMANSENQSYTAEHINEVTQRAQNRINEIVTLIEDSDYGELLSKHRQAAFDIVEFHGVRTMPEIAAMNAVGGEAMVGEYFRLMNLAEGNPQTLSNLRKQIPSFDAANVLAEGKNDIAKALSVMMGETPMPVDGRGNVVINPPPPSSGAENPVEQPPEKPGVFRQLLDAVSQLSIFSPDDEVLSAAALTRLQVLDKPAQTINMLSQMPNSYSRVTPEVRTAVKSQLTLLQNQGISNLVVNLAGTNSLLDFQDGQFVITNRQGETFSPQMVMEGSTVVGAPEALGVVNRLNGTLLALTQSDPRWADEANAEQAISDILDQVNSRLVVVEGVTRPDLGQEAGLGQGLSAEDTARLSSAASLDELFNIAQDVGLGDFSSLREQQQEQRRVREFFTDQEGNVFIVNEDGNLVSTDNRIQ